MKTQELWRASLRDLRRNPRKALILCLLAVVALYFWVPLAQGWAKRGKHGSAPALAHALGLGTPEETTPTAPETPTVSWQAIARALDECEWAKPLSRLDLPRDPFALPPPPQPVVQTNAGDKELQTAVQASKHPETLGLDLSGTIVGNHARTATINGRVYRLGDAIAARDQSQWTLIEIGERYVLLNRRGTVARIEMELSTAEKIRQENLGSQPASS